MKVEEITIEEARGRAREVIRRETEGEKKRIEAANEAKSLWERTKECPLKITFNPIIENLRLQTAIEKEKPWNGGILNEFGEHSEYIFYLYRKG